MSKRASGKFEKIDKDKYMTWDVRPSIALTNYINRRGLTYYEPCVGNGDMIRNLKQFRCVGFSDEELDARTTQYDSGAELFITNPPWTRSLLHPIIENLRVQKPTWLLFDADWMHTQQAVPHLEYCSTIISVGRLKWIPDTKMDGYDNCAWYLFVENKSECRFISRKGAE